MEKEKKKAKKGCQSQLFFVNNEFVAVDSKAIIATEFVNIKDNNNNNRHVNQ